MGDIVVLVKAAMNPELVRSKPDGSLDEESIPLKLSDIDRNALEEALKLKDKLGGKIYAITVLTWGPLTKRQKDLRMAVQEALAKGADEAIIVADESIIPGDQVSTSNAIIAAMKKHGLNPSIILAAEATIDETTGQVAGRIAAKMGYPYISFVRSMRIENGKVIAERDLEEDLEIVEAPLPVVVSVTQEINQPRPPTLIQIRRASKKPQTTYTGEQLDGLVKPKREIIERRTITISRKQVIIEGSTLEEVAEKLIDALEKEGVLRL
ncbi:MAG: electron transfer flavoprotein subunit beta/FixA family protein [Desulfurococcales archaeon]|nr:electron transfer flavoprotein subunit beta/FixA family protein [Desulfurococcales archaeon]